MVGGLLFSQVLTLYTTPVIYIFFDNLGRGFRERQCGRTTAERERTDTRGGARMNPSRVFIERPVATTLLTIAVAIAGIIAFGVLASFSAAAGGFSDDQRGGGAFGSEPGHHGIVDSDAAGTAVRRILRA